MTTVAQELRALALAIEELASASRSYSIAAEYVRTCCHALTMRAKISEMEQPVGVDRSSWDEAVYMGDTTISAPSNETAKSYAPRACTCHPDEAPKPCQLQFAFLECVDAAEWTLPPHDPRVFENRAGALDEPTVRRDLRPFDCCEG
jgi:hypothetical protein